MNDKTNHEDDPESRAQHNGGDHDSPPPMVVPAPHPGPTFNTPLVIRLFLVAAAIFFFKVVYDISGQTVANQQAISQINKKIDDLSVPLNEANRGINRLNGGFSDIVQGVSRMGKEVGKSSRNVQMIQNDVHEEMTSIRKKVNDISNRLTTVQQNLRDPFRR